MDEKKASIDNKEENEKNISDRRTDSVKCSSEQGGRGRRSNEVCFDYQMGCVVLIQ